MKKVLTILSVILVACILIAGIFSAGLFIGRIYFPQEAEVTNPLADAPVFVDPIFEETSPGFETLVPA